MECRFPEAVFSKHKWISDEPDVAAVLEKQIRNKVGNRPPDSCYEHRKQPSQVAWNGVIENISLQKGGKSSVKEKIQIN